MPYTLSAKIATRYRMKIHKLLQAISGGTGADNVVEMSVGMS